MAEAKVDRQERDYTPKKFQAFEERHEFYDNANEMGILFENALKWFVSVKNLSTIAAEDESNLWMTHPYYYEDKNENIKEKQRDALKHISLTCDELNKKAETMFNYGKLLREEMFLDEKKLKKIMFDDYGYIHPVPEVMGSYECIKIKLEKAQEGQQLEAHVKLSYDQPMYEEDEVDEVFVNEKVTITLFDGTLIEKPKSFLGLLLNMNNMIDDRFYPFKLQMYFNHLYKLLVFTKKLFDSLVGCISLMVMGIPETLRERDLKYEVFLLMENNMREFRNKVIDFPNVKFFSRKVKSKLDAFQIALQRKTKKNMTQKQEWNYVFSVVYSDKEFKMKMDGLPSKSQSKEYYMTLERTPLDVMSKKEFTALQDKWRQDIMKEQQEETPEYTEPDDAFYEALANRTDIGEDVVDMDGNPVRAAYSGLPTQRRAFIKRALKTT